MEVYYWKKQPNFGDLLNELIWPAVLRVPLSFQPSTGPLLVGIGTLLNERLPPDRTLHIMGSGVGYGTAQPTPTEHWKTHFLRGPLSAQILGYGKRDYVSDPGLLAARFAKENIEKIHECSFMPHHSFASDRYQRLCEQVGLNYICPRSDPLTVINSIAESERIICSAMHAAIVADALRVAWLPARTHPGLLEFKWLDWAGSLDIDLDFERLPTIYPVARPGLGWSTIASAKEKVVKYSLRKLMRRGQFGLSNERLLNSRLSEIEERIAGFNSLFE